MEKGRKYFQLCEILRQCGRTFYHCMHHTNIHTQQMLHIPYCYPSIYPVHWNPQASRLKIHCIDFLLSCPLQLSILTSSFVLSRRCNIRKVLYAKFYLSVVMSLVTAKFSLFVLKSCNMTLLNEILYVKHFRSADQYVTSQQNEKRLLHS